jgi:hypothetical protein
MCGGYQRFNRLPILPPGSLPLYSLRVLPIGVEVDRAARAMMPAQQVSRPPAEEASKRGQYPAFRSARLD